MGAKNAWAFDCQLRCGTWSLGMKLAEAMAVSDDKINTIMLIGGYRNGDYIDYKNPRVSFMYDLGAAGAAMILKKNYGRNRVIGSSFVTDGSLSGVVGVKGGGTKAGLRNFDPSLYYLDVFDREFMNQRLGEVSLPNFIKVIQDVCAMAGKETKDIGYLAMLHFKRSAHIDLLNRLGVPLERCIYLEEYGHMGQIGPDHLDPPCPGAGPHQGRRPGGGRQRRRGLGLGRHGHPVGSGGEHTLREDRRLAP